VGFPIRKSADQSSFAAPRGLSQRSTSFIASQRQGIHQTPLRHLIALIINAHPGNRIQESAIGNFPILTSDHCPLTSTDRKTSLRDRSDGGRSGAADCFERAVFCTASSPASSSSRACAADRGRNGARIDLLFTMSDNSVPCAAKREGTRNTQICGRVSSRLVEPDGIEPTTSCLQSRRSPN
jgi:hypothetical protein